ncbi:MAG: serine/threonine-protein phosphatase [Anaerolineae bacterium]|jgi:serine/threonine protein phosphatase PrpC|nr:serine/threonine-protein phosphatase [Anaerolineae bacterium]
MTRKAFAAGLEIGSLCDVGQKRKGKPNQDAIGLVLPQEEESFSPLLIVADGMGGYSGGEKASRLVIDAITNAHREIQPEKDQQKTLERYVQLAHQAVRTYAEKEPSLASMGSAVALALVENDNIYIASVGDSRVYLFRENRVVQLSQDQSWVATQVKAGLLSKEQARRHPKKNRLTMSISAKRPGVQPFSTSAKLGKNDIILLCSDGLWGVVPDTLIHAVAFELPPQKAAEKLVDLANAGQGPDNISVIIVRREGAELKSVFGSGDDETNP